MPRFAKMRLFSARRWRIALCLSSCFATRCCLGQDLAPRAYLITPMHSKAVILTYSLFDGNIEFAGSVPITGATARVSVPIFSYYHSFKCFGRSANFTAALPYGVGTFRGHVAEAEASAYRSGLLASTFRLSLNLIGGPAMTVSEFAKWRQKRILGASFRLVPLAGQYDPTKLVNLGNNRWAFKPEIGYSQRWGRWVLDAYGGAWFFTTNSDFFSRNAFSPGTNTQKQSPIGSFEGHFGYDFKPRLWVSLDGNFWFGGRTSLNGLSSSATAQRNSRLGATLSVPLNKHQSVKLSYNNGAYIKYGGNFQNISLGWQYSWLGRP